MGNGQFPWMNPQEFRTKITDLADEGKTDLLVEILLKFVDYVEKLDKATKARDELSDDLKVRLKK